MMDEKFWLDLAQFIMTASVGIYVWLVNRRKATTASIDALRREVTAMQADNENRITRVESEIAHLPTNGDIKEINKSLSNMEGSLKGLTRAVDLMNEYLLNRKDH